MTEASSLLSHAGLLAASSSKSGSGSLLLPILLIGFIAIYFLWLRPQRNRLRQQQAATREFEVGDEVVTTAGIVGRVLSIEGDRLVLETGRGDTMTILRSAIARRVDPVPDEDFPATDGGSDQAGGEDKDWWPGREADGPGSSGGPS